MANAAKRQELEARAAEAVEFAGQVARQLDECGSDFHRLYDAVTAQLEHERDAAETDAERALVMRLYAAVWDATYNMKESPNV